jgi:hypothetical protein
VSSYYSKSRISHDDGDGHDDDGGGHDGDDIVDVNDGVMVMELLMF